MQKHAVENCPRAHPTDMQWLFIQVVFKGNGKKKQPGPDSLGMPMLDSAKQAHSHKNLYSGCATCKVSIKDNNEFLCHNGDKT